MMYRSSDVAAAALVAGGGGLLTFLLATRRGRAITQQANGILDDLADALEDLRVVAQRMDAAAQQGNAMVADVRRALPQRGAVAGGDMPGEALEASPPVWRRP